MVSGLIYRTMFVLCVISLLSPTAHMAALYFADLTTPALTPSIVELPSPWKSLEAIGGNPILFGIFFPGFNAIVRAIFMGLALHRIYRFISYKAFVVPASFRGTLLIVALLGCVSFFVSLFMVTAAHMAPGLNHLAFLAAPISMGTLFLPWTFAVSELFLLRDGAFGR